MKQPNGSNSSNSHKRRLVARLAMCWRKTFFIFCFLLNGQCKADISEGNAIITFLLAILFLLFKAELLQPAIECAVADAQLLRSTFAIAAVAL